MQFPHPYKKRIVWFYEFGMFLDYASVGIKRNRHEAAFLFQWG